jgi:ParB-like chromosome segregation protein Spo0J
MTSQPITPLVLSTEPILRLAAQGEGKPIRSGDVMAATGLDGGSARRELRRLVEANLLSVDGEGKGGTLYIPTGDTYDAVAALDRAAGVTGASAEAQAWPHAGFKPNPDQPRKAFPHEMIRDLAESIVQVGGLLHNLVAYPPDASGVRMLHDGECRWRACALLLEEDRLPESLKLGLPFTEREGTELEMLKVALVANHQRGDLAPWEDARGLHRVKVLTGLSARGVAMLVGRAKEGSERGVKDVQEKIRAVDRASAEDIALHEAGELSWEKLRDNIREARTISPHAALAMAELRWKVERDGRHPGDDVDTCWVLSDGQGDRWGSHRELVEARLIETTGRLLNGILSPLVKITEQGVAWLNKAAPLTATRLAAGDDDQALDYLRHGWGRMEGALAGPGPDVDEGFVTPWLNAAALQAQIERRRAGLPDRDPDQVDLEEAIAASSEAVDAAPGPWREGDDHEAWVRKKLRHALGSIKPRDLLAVVELADACHFKPQGEQSHGYARTRTWSYETPPGKPQALISEYGCGGGSGGGEPEYSQVHSATLEWLTDNGLFKPEGGGARSAMLYRVRQGVSQSGADQCEVTGRYHTSWLNPPAEPKAEVRSEAVSLLKGTGSQVDENRMRAFGCLTPAEICQLVELADKQFFEGVEEGQWIGWAAVTDQGPLGVRGNLAILGGGQGFGAGRSYARIGSAIREFLEKKDLFPRTPRSRVTVLFEARLKAHGVLRASEAEESGRYVTEWLNDRAPALEVSISAADPDLEDETPTGRLIRTGRRAAQLIVAHYDSLQADPAATEVYRQLSEALNAAELENRARIEAMLAPPPADESVLLTFRVGDLVNNGGASDYRLISRKDHHDSRVFDFLVQPILNGKEHGGVRALNLNQIQRLGGHNIKTPTPTALALQSGAPLPAAEVEAPEPEAEPEDPERDAINQDEYRTWIADALATNHQADPEAAPGFAIEAFDNQTGGGTGIKFLATPGTWRRADAAFDAADWAAENLLAGLRIEHDQTQTQGEEADVVA